MVKKIFCLFTFLFPSLVFAEYEVNNTSLFYDLSKGYCYITHPVEWFGTQTKADENPLIRRNATCEKQHIIQQQSNLNFLDNKDRLNTVFWAESYHSRTDRWNDRPWQNKPPFWIDAGFSKDASRGLYEAYMLGTWGLSYSLFKHDYNGANSKLILLDNDGVSNVLYSWAYIVNLPQKYIHQLAYLIDKNRYSLIIDLLIAVPILIAEAMLAIFAGMIGLILGTIMNPLDTVMAIPGGVIYAVDTFITAIWHIAVGVKNLIFALF